MTAPSPKPAGRPFLAAVVVVGVLACSVYANLSFAVTRPANYRWFPPFERNVNANDNRHLGAEYFNIARALVRGQGFANPFGEPTGPTAWMPPLFPTFLAGLLWACDGDKDAVMVVVLFVQFCVLAGTGLLVLALARRTNRRLGAGLGVAVFFTFLLANFHLCFQFTHDCWLVLLALDLLVAGLCWLRPLHGPLATAGWGLFGGLTALVNPVVAFAWGMATLVLAFRHRLWSRLALAVLAAGLTLLPWTARNGLVFGRLIPVKSNLAYELYQSQCLQKTGLLHNTTFATHPYASATGERRQYKALGEMAFLDHKREQFRQAVAADPLDFLDRAACRFLGATLWYEPLDPVKEARHPWSRWFSRLTHPLPFLGLLVLLLTATWQPLGRAQGAVIGVYSLYLLPYAAISYYERYAMPLLGAKVLLVIWGADRVVSLLLPKKVPARTESERRLPAVPGRRPGEKIMRSHPPLSRPVRRGFSLIEMVVVVGIIGILLSLMLPAVQRARESAIRTQCANNLRQVGLALTQFHDTYRLFPSNGGWDGKQTIPSANGPPFTPSTHDFTPGQTYQWGVGDPMLKPREQTGSWAFCILPYMEEMALYDARMWQGSVTPYICPARRSPTALPVWDQDAYGQYQGGGWTWGRIDFAVNLYVFDNRPVCKSMAAILDGLSNTILIGEKAFNPMVEQPQSWYWDEPFFLGGSKGTSRGGLGLTRDNAGRYFANGQWYGNYEDNPYKENWGSPHPGGVHFFFGDGAVRMVPRDIEPAAFAAMLTPDGHEPVVLP